ncbi:MAG: hypothetical protein HFI45_18255 [Lachnospiraceae bacterium]|nr:hypothetical protein [Lachnospiraceae bacterium]
MPITEKLSKKNNELQKKVISEIEKVKVGQSKKNILQLQTILNELQNSDKKRDMTLSYPRTIIDSWDYSDQLGNELIELAELYKKISDV